MVGISFVVKIGCTHLKDVIANVVANRRHTISSQIEQKPTLIFSNAFKGMSPGDAWPSVQVEASSSEAAALALACEKVVTYLEPVTSFN